MTTTEFLNQVDEKWAELQTFVASLRPEQYTSPTDAAGWSVQDHLLHLSEWEAGVTALLNYQDRVAAMGLTPELWAARDFDAMNEVLRKNAAQYGGSSETVKARINDAHGQLRAKIAAFSDDDLQKPYSHWAPNSGREYPIIDLLIGDTTEHYPEHIEWMQAILDSGK